MIPSTGLETPRPDLSEAFVEFGLNDQFGRLIGTQAMPIFNVPVVSGDYHKLSLKQLLKNTDMTDVMLAGRRNPDGSYAEDDLEFTEATFKTYERGLVGRVDQNESRAYATSFDHEQEVAVWTQHRLAVLHERRVAYRFANNHAGTVACGNTDGQGAHKWSDYANATPIEDIRYAKRQVWEKTGFLPDTVIMSEQALEHLRLTDEVRGVLEATGAGGRAAQGDITFPDLARVFGVSQFLVGGAIYDSSSDISAAASITNIWGSDVYVCKIARSNSFREPAFGHTLHWSLDDSMPNGYVESYYDVNTRCNKIRVRHQTDEHVKYSDLNYKLTAAY